MQALTKNKAPKKPKKITDKYLDNVASYYLSRYSSSTSNLKRILMKRAYKSCEFHEAPLQDAEEMIDNLIKRYQELGYLDDSKYAISLARNLREKGKSSKQITQKMYEKMIPENLIPHSISVIDQEIENEYEEDVELLSAWRLAKKRRIGIFRKQDKQEEYRKKDLASLARAGFSYEIAKKVLDGNEVPIFIQKSL